MESSVKVSVKTARTIDRPNAAKVIVSMDETNVPFIVWTNPNGRGLWIDGKQVLGTAEFSVGRNPNAAYRRYFSK